MESVVLQDKIILPDPVTTVCFAGPRPGNLPDKGEKNSAAILEIGRKLRQKIIYYIAAGKTTFINGGMSGFDTIAGETVLELQREYPKILCVTIAPFRINYFGKDFWTPEWKQRALNLYTRSNIAFSLSNAYHKGVYYERNKYMADHSSVLLCYYAGAGRGTKYTLDYAGKKQLNICNIAPDSSYIYT